MLKIILLILLLGTSPVLAQIAAIQGHSFLGGTQAVTSGLKSSNYMQGIVPYATICVYNTGTTAPATIYANASGAPLSSCFTSNASISTDPGGWIFWAAINQGLDVVMSGGVSPNMYPAPVTISDLYPSTQIISGCGLGTVCPISQGGTGATTAAGALSNLGGASLSGATFTGAISGTSASFSGTVTASSFSGAGSGLTGTAAGLSIGGNAATATNVTGTVAIANGGTGATTAAGALSNLGIGGLSALNCGAKGDGVTDDTAALNACFTSARTANQSLYLPTPSVCYKVSSPLLFGGFSGVGMRIVGDGRGVPSAGTASPICYTSAISSTSPVIDAVVGANLIISGISIIPLNGTTSAGSCVFSEPLTTGGGNVRIYNSYLNCGAASGGSAVAIIAQDLSSVIGSRLYSLGNALILGQFNGTNTTVSSYTTGPGYGDTHLHVGGSIIQSPYSPLEFTGSADLVVDNDGGATYIAEIGAGDSTHAVIDMSNAEFPEVVILDGINVENQSLSTPFASFATTNSSGVGAGGSVKGGIFTGRLLGGAVTLAGTFIGTKFIGSGMATAFTDTTNFSNGEYTDTTLLTTLSPTAGSSPGFIGSIGGSKITGYGWNAATVAAQPTNAYNGGFTICSSNNVNGVCYTNSGVNKTSANFLSPVTGTTFTGTNFTGTLTGNAATATNVPYSGLTGTVPTWNQNTTGNAATATQATNATNATNVNGGTVSATTGTFSGTVAAGTATPTTIGSNGVLLNGVPALQAQTSLGNYYSGGAGNLTGTGAGNTANGYQALHSNTTGSDNTANGYAALSVNTTGSDNTANGYVALPVNTTGTGNTANGMYTLHSNTTGSENTANGYQALYYNTTGFSNTANGVNALSANTTGYNNTANGYQALFSNTTGFSNTANGYQALYSNTTGYSNTANGVNALSANTTGYYNTANGYQAGQYIADAVTANQTSSYSVYEGFQAYPLANGDTNENVIGNDAIGHGSNTTTLGNSATVGTWLNGTQHITATAPITSAGTVAAYSTNAGGAITSLSAATTVTITFANSGWTNAAFCVATPSVSLATAPYVSAISLTAVTFTFVALTGNLYYHCDGN
jgi:hypothetical protein